MSVPPQWKQIIPQELKRPVRRAVSRMRLRRLDSRPIPKRSDELRMFMFVKDEVVRLPHMLDYHRKLGVDRIFVVDNGSSDGTVEYFLKCDDVHLWQSDEVLHRQDIWRDLILRRFGHDCWWLLLDPDEQFLFPRMGSTTLKAFTHHLDQCGANALHTVFLDVYPDGPIGEVDVEAGTDPLNVSPWFDPPAFKKTPHSFVRCRGNMDYVLTGGVRGRVFGLDSCCSKFPLIKYTPGMFLPRGTHYIEGATMAEEWGTLLHFKFLGAFREKAKREAERGVYWMGGHEYKMFNKTIAQEPELTIRTPESLRYEGEEQLLELGMMKSSMEWDKLVDGK